VKRFVSTFSQSQTVGMTPWMGDQPNSRPLSAQANINTEKTQTNTRALSGIQTHDPNVRAGEDISCLRPRGHCDRLPKYFFFLVAPTLGSSLPLLEHRAEFSQFLDQG
jgi:hypothetical protein